MADIVVGVPGFWKNDGDFLDAMARTARGRKATRFVADGSKLLEMSGRAGKQAAGHVEFEIYKRDPRMREAFDAVGQGRLSEDLLDSIERHAHTVYLIADEGLEPARRLLRAADFLLDAGGLAVKVESTGVAHTPERWRYLAGSPSTLSAYEAFVVLVGGKDFNYSCGMRTFGLPDASVTAEVPLQEGAEVLTAFNHWRILEQPSLRDGGVFCTATGEPCFVLRHEAYGYGPDDLLNNDKGRWHLELTDERLPTPALNTSDEPLFMAMKRDDPELLEGVKRARATVPYFLAHFTCPHEYGRSLFKIRLEKEQTYLWLTLRDVKGTKLVGSFFELPPDITQYKVGQTLEVSANDIYDWAIIKSGTLLGGYSMRISRGHLKPEQRGAYDQMTGTISYAPLDEIPA